MIQALPGALIALIVVALVAATGWWLRARSRREVRKAPVPEDVTRTLTPRSPTREAGEAPGVGAGTPPPGDAAPSAGPSGSDADVDAGPPTLFDLSEALDELAPLAEPPRPDDPDAAAGEERPAFPGHDLRFTVYRPSVAVPGRWYDLLVFMYEFVHPSDRLASELHPEERMEREVRRVLGEDAPAYVSATEDAAAAVPRQGVLTFEVELPGFRVNPPRQTVGWLEDLQRVGFRIQADPGRTGRTVRGRLTVFHGPLILAEMALVIPVGEGEDAPMPESLRPYRRIFASYARADDTIVRRLDAFAASVGDRYLRDVASLRAGEEWNPGLARLIEEADIFQLFWSWNAMESEWVRREWTHALNLRRPGFIRPVYWEDPMPRRPERGLPPPELSELHFHRLPRTLVGAPLDAEPAPGTPARAAPVALPGAAEGTAPGPPPGAPVEIAPRAPGMERHEDDYIERLAEAREPVSVASRTRGRPTASRLRWALPAVAVAVLALGTSTLMMVDGPASTYPRDQNEASAGTGEIADQPGGAGAGRPATGDRRVIAASSGVLVAEVTLDDVALGGVGVRLETSDGTVLEATTADDGRATFRGVPRGTVRLTVFGVPEGTRLDGPPQRVVVTSADTARAALRLQRPGAGPLRREERSADLPGPRRPWGASGDRTGGSLTAAPGLGRLERATVPHTPAPVRGPRGPDRHPPPGRAGR